MILLIRDTWCLFHIPCLADKIIQCKIQRYGNLPANITNNILAAFLCIGSDSYQQKNTRQKDFFTVSHGSKIAEPIKDCKGIIPVITPQFMLFILRDNAQCTAFILVTK